MDTIRIQGYSTQSTWQKMQGLKQRWDTAECKVPESEEGKGDSFVEIQKVAQEYVLMREMVSLLLTNTLQFLQQTEKTFTMADEKMAEELKG